jgi:hypothetical protein
MFLRRESIAFNLLKSLGGVIRETVCLTCGVNPPTEASDSVPCHNSTCFMVAWYLASRSPSKATC